MENSPALETPSLFEQIGGRRALFRIVTRFYDKVLADVRIAHLFAGIDPLRLERHQVRFLTYATGGDQDYPGPSLRAAHANLVAKAGLDDAHFDAVCEHLADVLLERRVDAHLIREVLDLVESTRNDVLCR